MLIHNIKGLLLLVMNNNIQTNQKNQQKVKHSTESQLTLPEWLHNIKIRFYKNKFPRQNEIVMAHIKRIDDGRILYGT